MSRMTAAQRQDIQFTAYTMMLKGYSIAAIARDLGRSQNFIADLIAEENERRHDEYDAGYADREAIEFYKSVILEADRRLESLEGARSLNVSGLLNVKLRAHERIDKITGVESPTKYQDVGDFTIEWPDLEPADFDTDSD